MQNQKPSKLPSGATINHGQLFADPRNGAPKRTTVPAIAFGMKRQTQPSHEFLHGQAVDDETADKLSQDGRTVPVHPSMVR